MFSNLTNDEITAQIETEIEPDHPEAPSPGEIRTALRTLNNHILNNWFLQDALNEGIYEIRHEDSEKIIIEHNGHLWNELFIDIGEYTANGLIHRIASSIHFEAATTHCGTNWPNGNPFVIVKPTAFKTGEQHVLRKIARRTEELGSVARAVDTLATETHDWNKSQWASLTDRNPSTVSRTTDN